MNKLTLCLLSLALPALALAQDAFEETGEPEIRRYTVEVIIFRYAQDVGVGNEIFPPDEPEMPELAEAEDGITLFDEVPEQPGDAAADAGEPEEEAEPLPDIELVLLEEDGYRMREIYARLERLDAYEPLMHFGWTQATWPEDETEAIPLHLFGRPPAELDGSLKLYLGRYLHLVADLQLKAPDEAADIMAPPVFFRINEDRILRNGELRYYDHPKFGLLARTSRVEEVEETEPGELLGYPVQ